MNILEFRARIVEHLNENNARKAIEELLEIVKKDEDKAKIIELSENLETLVVRFQGNSFALEQANLGVDDISLKIVDIVNNLEIEEDIQLKNPKALYNPIEIPFLEKKEKVSNLFVLKVFIGVIFFGVLYMYYSAKLKPPQIQISGIVSNIENQPLENTKIIIAGKESKTENNGVFQLSINKIFPAGLSIEKSGYKRLDTLLKEMPKTKLKIRLQPVPSESKN